MQRKLKFQNPNSKSMTNSRIPSSIIKRIMDYRKRLILVSGQKDKAKDKGAATFVADFYIIITGRLLLFV